MPPVEVDNGAVRDLVEELAAVEAKLDVDDEFAEGSTEEEPPSAESVAVVGLLFEDV